MESAKTAILTEIMLTIFRVNGSLLREGDKLVAPLDLTSARWQVLGAVALAGQPLTAPQIAGAMGITRQGVQKQVNALAKEGLLEVRPNPEHKRSHLIALTAAGRETYAEVDRLRIEWVGKLGDALPNDALQVTLRTLQALQGELDVEA